MTVTAAMQADPATAAYQCTNCGCIYLPERGDSDGGIAPGTAFDALPNDWQLAARSVSGARPAAFLVSHKGGTS